MSEYLLSDRIQEFMDWLEEMTDFGDWDQSLKTEVHKKLIECMIPVWNKIATQEDIKDVYAEGLAVGMELGRKLK